MNVYILIGANYHEDDFAVIGAYSTFDNAKAQKEKEEALKEYDRYIIVEAELDK